MHISSKRSFEAGGFNYDIKEASFFDLNFKIDDVMSLPGVFNMPMCQVGSNEMSFSDFKNYLESPDKFNGLPGRGKRSYCACLDRKDKNGKKFREVLPKLQDAFC